MTSAELIAGLVRKHVKGVPLAINHPTLGRPLYIAELYQTDRGFVFANIGWNSNDCSHPFHVVEGEAAPGYDGEVIIVHGEKDLRGRQSVSWCGRPNPPRQHPPNPPRQHPTPLLKTCYRPHAAQPADEEGAGRHDDARLHPQRHDNAVRRHERARRHGVTSTVTTPRLPRALDRKLSPSRYNSVAPFGKSAANRSSSDAPAVFWQAQVRRQAVGARLNFAAVIERIHHC